MSDAEVTVPTHPLGDRRGVLSDSLTPRPGTVQAGTATHEIIGHRVH